MDDISYDDFSKLDLRVAKIVSTEKIPEKSRIIKGTISLGDEERDVIIGGAQFYEPEDLIGKIVEIYIDDTIIFASTRKELMTRLETVLSRLKKFNIFLNPEKAKIGLNRVEYLGHIIDENGIAIDDKKTETLCNLRIILLLIVKLFMFIPTSKKKIQTQIADLERSPSIREKTKVTPYE